EFRAAEARGGAALAGGGMPLEELVAGARQRRVDRRRLAVGLGDVVSATARRRVRGGGCLLVAPRLPLVLLGHRPRRSFSCEGYRRRAGRSGLDHRDGIATSDL